VVRIWQYQIEREGGQRYGPSWNHEQEVKDYIAKLAGFSNEINNEAVKITKYWIDVPDHQVKGVPVEIV